MSKAMQALWKEILGEKVVIRYTPSGSFVNPDGTGTKELSPEIAKEVVAAVRFRHDCWTPIVVDEDLARSGVAIAFQGL